MTTDFAIGPIRALLRPQRSGRTTIRISGRINVRDGVQALELSRYEAKYISEWLAAIEAAAAKQP